jgi:succinoglycan biosynthesis transport protein ExoP
LANEGGLPELVDAIRWRWKTALLIAVAVFAAAFLYIESLPPKYDGKAVVAIEPRPNVPTAGADTVRVVAPKYVAYVEAPATAQKVASSVGIDPSALDGVVNAVVAPDTGNLTITARMKSPTRAAAVANGFADAVVSFARNDALLSAQTVARAVPESAPASPPRRLLEAAAALVGLFFGIGASVLIERARPRLRSWRDMAKITGYPVLGRVPSTRRLKTHPTEAFSDPVTGAAFRTLRANLEPQLREKDIDLLLITSPEKGDGKTTVAALLAESLGRLGMRVLLIDADLKRPRLARLARLDGEAGLAAVLREEMTLAQAIRPGWIDELSLLPTRADPEGGDLLARRFVDVIREAREDYDLILVDAPPLLGTDDARSLAPVAEGVLLVVSAGSNSNPVSEAVLAVESLKTPLLGIIGNRLKEGRGAYYY